MFTNNFSFKDFIKKKKSKKIQNFLKELIYSNHQVIRSLTNDYNYSYNHMKILTTKYKKIFFYQNFSDGIQKENIIINPTPDLNQSRNLKNSL